MSRLVALAVALGSINEVASTSDAEPVSKAITLISDLRDMLTLAGEFEATTYDTFACFCKDTMTSTGSAISDAETNTQTLQANLNSATLARDNADMQIAQVTKSISDLREEIEGLTEQRNKELHSYGKSELDLTGAIQSLDAAIQTLKAAKLSTSFLALPPLAKTLERAIASVSSIEASPAQEASLAAASLQLLQQLQEPTNATEDYSFHADDIIGTLEDLRTQFKTKKGELDRDEMSQRQTYEQQVQAKESSISSHETDLASHQRSKAAEVQRVVEASKDLSATSAQLMDDKAFLTDLSAKCHEKAVLWDDRTKTRVAELSALTHALGVLESLGTQPGKGAALAQKVKPHLSKIAFHMPEQAEEELPIHRTHVLAQVWGVPRPKVREHKADDWRSQLGLVLIRRATQLQSISLLKLAKRAEEDPFAKVKVLIQNLIERLLSEATAEANHKGWCDHEVGLAEQSRDRHATALKEINGLLEVGEARWEQIRITVNTLTDDLAELNETLDNNTQLRASEKQEHDAAIKEANESSVAVAEVIDILTKFYDAAKNNATQAAVNLIGRGMLGGGNASDPGNNASGPGNASAPGHEPQPVPDAGFDDAYGGAQGDREGVIGMLEVIQSGFESSIAETQKLEEQAVREFNELETSIRSLIAEKEEIHRERNEALQQARDTNEEHLQQMDDHVSDLSSVIEELVALKAACFPQPVTAAERKMKRDEELAALRQALCILNQHGVGSADEC